MVNWHLSSHKSTLRIIQVQSGLAGTEIDSFKKATSFLNVGFSYSIVLFIQRPTYELIVLMCYLFDVFIAVFVAFLFCSYCLSSDNRRKVKNNKSKY